MSEIKNEKQYIKMIKTCLGNLRVALVNPNTQIAHQIEFKSDQETKVLPIELASLVYCDTASGAFRAFKAGYFTFDDVPAIRAYAEERGLLIGDVDFTPEPANYKDLILQDLLSGSKTRIESHFDTAKHQEDVARVAREHLSELTKGVISLIEKSLKVTLVVDGE